MTNGDRIRSMSDEELAEAMRTSKDHMCHFCRNKYCTLEDCRKGYLKWLKQEAEECHYK